VIVRNSLDALAQRPLSLLTSAWPWRSAGYLLASTAVGACAAALFWAGYLLWNDLAPATAMLVLVPLVAAAWAVSAFERWRLFLVMRPPDGDRPALLTAAGARELVYGVVGLLLLWWIDLGVLGVAAGLPLFLMAAPFQPTASPAVSWIAPIFGVMLVPIAVYPIAVWAGVRGAMTRALLIGGTELEQVIRSRARLVDGFEVERRRIERDLHDGAQQRLVTLSMRLGVTALDLPAGSPAATELREARDEVQLVLKELRELIHNIHPRVLTDLGLEPSVRDLAARSIVPVDVDIDLPQRPSAQVESTAYFVVCEALANVAKHSQATTAAVRGRFVADKLVLEIRDDGIGGARAKGGTGLVGIVDRLAVLDGHLSLHSPAGGPTALRVEIPCAT
jgi:signal transduction histidine kinase